MFESASLRVGRSDTEPASYRSTSDGAENLRTMRYDTWPPASEAPEEGDQRWVKLERTTSIWEVQRQITGISTAQATFSVIASLMGASILALPFAIATTGWLFVPVLALITSACCYTARLLVVLVNEVQPAAGDYRQAQQQHGMSTVSTYENLAETILGRAGLVFTSGVIFVELYGVGVGYLILLGANLHRVFPAVSAAQFTVVSAAALYPSLLVGFEALSNFSSLGLVSAVVVTASVFQAAWAVVASTAAEVHNNSGKEAALGGGGGYGEIGSSGGNGESGGSDGLGVWSGALNELLADHTSLFVPSGMGASCGIALFSFASHAIVPEIYASTKDKRSFPKALDCAFAIVLVLFIAIGSCGYLAYGDSVDQQFTLDLSAGVAQVACLAISVNVALGFGLFVASPCKLLETALAAPYQAVKRVASSSSLARMSFDAIESDDDDDGDAVDGSGRSGGDGGCSSSAGDGKIEGEPAKPWPFLRLGVVVSATVVALRFPDFATVLSLIGCVCDMTICFILPSVMHAIVVKRVWASRCEEASAREARLRVKEAVGAGMELAAAAARGGSSSSSVSWVPLRKNSASSFTSLASQGSMASQDDDDDSLGPLPNVSGGGGGGGGGGTLREASGLCLAFLVAMDAVLVVVGVVGMVVGVQSALG